MTEHHIKEDAKGQFAPSQADRRNDGQASATPRSVTGEDDATVENSGRKPSPNPGFDIREQTNRRN
jgi:hypothetical protein